MTLKTIALILALALLAAACGDAGVTDDVASAETSSPTTTAASSTAASTSAPAEPAADDGVAAETDERETSGDEAPSIDASATIPPAVSELNRDPVGGGGNPQGSVAELLSFTAEEVTGGEVDVSSYLGRDVVLWFWAPWCSWCNAEAPRVSAAAAEFDGQVDIVGVAGVAHIDDMRSFVDRHGLEHITHIADVDGSIWLDFDVTYQPWWIFINDDGTVIDNWQGRLGDEEIRDRLATLAST